ncbi:MAG: biotin--[acetyl-CoA-carboxylase] ligase, partial [Alkalibacterium sp.]
DDLKNKATSIKEATGQEIDPNKLAGTFLNYFEKLYTDFLKSQQTEPFLSLCRKHSALIGKDYWIIDNDDKRKATIRTIDESGGLVVTYNDTNETETITSTALSIRGDESYL